MLRPVVPDEHPFPPEMEALGFSTNLTGGHMARSMMLSELKGLLGATLLDACRDDYRRTVEDENLLGKATVSSRRKTFRHLVELYGLDPGLALFRVLRLIAAEDPEAVPGAGMVCTYCRDTQLRWSFSLVESLTPGETLTRQRMEGHLEVGFPKRFSGAMKKSLAQNLNTTWTASGHLSGRSVKLRTLPSLRPMVTVYAMFAGWLAGLRGQILLQSVFGRLAGVEPDLAVSHLATASAQGWLRLRNAGGITEIDFTPLLTERETNLLHVPD
jgi:hypothetical protein